MQRKYSILRIVATIFKVLAWIALVFGVLGACGSIVLGAAPGLLGGGNQGGSFNPGLGALGIVGGIVGGLAGLFGSVLVFLVLYTYGDMISLLIDLEENTRLTAERLLTQPLPPTTTDTTLSTTKIQ